MSEQEYTIKSRTMLPKIKVNPILIIVKKTFIFDVCTIKKFIMSIILMTIVPVIVLSLAPFSSGDTISTALGAILFFYTYGLIFPLIIGTSAAPLISEELKSGTMLSLVSKPISREGIVLGKFIALLLFGMLASATSLIVMIIVGATRHPFPDNFDFFSINFLYSLIIIFCFGGMSLGFSSVFKKPRNVNLIPVIIIVFSFLVGIMIKQLLMWTPDGTASIYEKYQLYHFDVSYHMANVYVLLMEQISEGSSRNWGFFMIMFGVYRPTLCDPSDPYPWCVELSNYYLPGVSVFMLVFVFGILLIIGGTLYFKKRDIS